MADLTGAVLAAPGRHHSLARRRGAPGQEYSATTLRGEVTTVTADAQGVIQPDTAEEVQLCDSLGLEVIHDDEPTSAAASVSLASEPVVDRRTVKVLTERAAELGVEVDAAWKRPELLAAVQAAEAPTTPDTTETDGAAGGED